jgi:ribonucleotide monophosphatase NagD (HAD superfamily)
MIHRAAADHSIDLARSCMVGDRPSDIAAGAAAGCRTIQVASGMHVAPPIETTERFIQAMRPDHVCASLLEAAQCILTGHTSVAA